MNTCLHLDRHRDHPDLVVKNDGASVGTDRLSKYSVLQYPSGMSLEGMPEEERQATLRDLEKKNPGASHRAAGNLAGPATEGRPNVPIWNYDAYVTQHPEESLDDLLAVRFPVVFYGESGSTIDSGADYLRGDPQLPSFFLTAESVIQMWKELHDAGVVVWDSNRRLVEHVKPLEAYKAALSRFRDKETS